MSEATNDEKRRQFERMMEHGIVMLHLDPRPADVAVPAHYKQQVVLRLNIAYGFNLPALDIGPEGIFAVLSFNRVNFGCSLPWEAIFALTQPSDLHSGMLWPESLPPELRVDHDDLLANLGGVPVQLEPPGCTSEEDCDDESCAERQLPPKRAQRPQLTVIDGEGGGTEAPADAPEGDGAPADSLCRTPNRPGLKLVKG